MNRVILIGNIASDIELKKTQSNKSVCEFRVATNEYSGEQKTTEFHTVQAWERDAEQIAMYCRKGSKIAVEGRIHYSSYEGKDGSKVNKTVVVLNRKEFLSPRQEEPQQYTQDVNTFEVTERFEPQIEFEPDDLPFY